MRKCTRCGSFNLDDRSTCGMCGRSLAEADQEKRVDVIPLVVPIPGGIPRPEYAVLVTDKRSIFVFEKGSRGFLSPVVGGAVGIAIQATDIALKALAKRKTIDYEKTNPDELADDKDNITIPHSLVRKIGVKKRRLVPHGKLVIDFEAPNGKTEKIEAALIPPSEIMKEKKEQGAGRKDVSRDYAIMVQDVYRKALPVGLAVQADWEF